MTPRLPRSDGKLGNESTSGHGGDRVAAMEAGEAALWVRLEGVPQAERLEVVDTDSAPQRQDDLCRPLELRLEQPR